VTTWIIADAQPGTGPRVAVKDLIDMAGLPTTAGSRAVAATARPATRDAACLAGLRAAIREGRARFAGKANLHELAYGISGVSAAYGTPVNPLDPRLVPGGSSSGSATAVAAGEADIAYGTDTGGSIRIPAACCGIAGLKTTWGRVSLDGVRPLAPGLDTVGPMARDVAGLITGMTLLEPGFTVASALLRTPPKTVGLLAIDADPVIGDAVRAALRAAGLDVRPVTVPGLDAIIAASGIVLDAQAWQTNKSLLAAAPGLIGADVRERLLRAAAITAAQLAAAQDTVASWRGTLDRLWQRVDLLAAPTLLGFPPLVEDAHSMFAIRGLTSPVNVAGLPALALPVPVAGPVPASLQLIGPAGSEDRLLAAGALVEQAVSGLLLVREAGVHRQRHAGDVAGVVGDQPEDRVGDVHRLDHGDGERIRHRVRHLRVLGEELGHRVVDDHGRVHAGGVHRVHPDAVLGEGVGVGAHEPHDAVLGRGVAEAAAGGAADAVDPRGRAGQHDRAAPAALLHRRDGGLHGVEHAGEVDIDHVLPGAVLLMQRHGRDAGVRQHDVDRADLGDALLKRPPELGFVAYVGLRGEDAPVERLDLLGGLGEIVGGGHRVGHGVDLPADVHGDDVRGSEVVTGILMSLNDISKGWLLLSHGREVAFHRRADR
jgi:amidase